MAIRRIDRISCSLNLGLIYSLSYSYSPQSGVKMTIFFINQSGEYTEPNLLPLQKANIQIGRASFSLYPIRTKISKSSGRRVMSVDFVDDTFLLDNYYVVLTGRGCGERVYQLGSPVDNRSLAQKQASALDPVAEQISEFIEFPDLEYSFDDFLKILRQKFNVLMMASYDTTITNSFTGTFREVLDSWLNFYNLSYFFENGTIKIFDPTKLTINLPTKPTDAIEYEIEQDITSTYGKTVFNWFQQQGDEIPLNQSSNDDSGSLYIRTADLYPVGYERNLQQSIIVKGVDLGTLPNINQVVAASFGKEFWFLYNYNAGTAEKECGWSTSLTGSLPTTTAANSLTTSIQIAGLQVASIDKEVFESRFNAYYNYGKIVAGKYYLSNRKDDIDIDKDFTWFNETDGQIFNFLTSSTQRVDVQYISQPGQTTIVEGVIPETVINDYFPGVNFIGARMVYIDKFVQDFTPFQLSPDPTDQSLQLEANKWYAALVQGTDGTRSMDFSAYGNKDYLAYGSPIFSQAMSDAFKNVSALATATTINGNPNPFLYRYTAISLAGIKSADYASLKAAENESDDVEIVEPDQGPSLVSNTSVIKALKQGSYSVFYKKYSQCASASSAGNYYAHKFVPKQISTDIAIDLTFSKSANNTYVLNRDLNTINQLVNNPFLPQLAQGRPFPTKRVTFSLNYFYDVPINFLTNGLVNMDISIGDQGITSSYTFSNEVLQIPDVEPQFNKFEQQIRNSWIRLHEPKQIIS